MNTLGKKEFDNMKKVIASLALLMMALPVFAMDIAKDPAVYVEGTQQYNENITGRGTAAVAVIYDGTFFDGSAYYVAGLGNAGLTADVYYDPAGGVDYSGYDVVVADCGDNWWYSLNYPAEINAWAAYCDGGGSVFLIGQDFLYGSADYTFPTVYCGMASAFEDVNYNDISAMTYVGSAGGPIEGLSDTMLPCFEANPWFTDDIVAATQQLCEWTTVDFGGPYGGGSCAAAGVFSVVEFACGVTDVVPGVVYWYNPTATQDKSFGEVKTLY